jgi:predicted RecA/RadA family phage recombinase
MANNYLYSGRVIGITSASGAITSGTLVYQEGFIGVALNDADSGASFDLCQEGVWELPVPSGVTKGDVLYGDLAGGDAAQVTLTTTATTNTTIGIAVTDRDGDGNAQVLLSGLGHAGAVVADA